MLELLFGGANARRAAAWARVLEIGTGCGYQAALLAQLATHVVSIERLRALHDKARELLAPLRRDSLRLVYGDGRLGHAPNAPYDSIIAAAGGEEMPAGLARAARRRRTPGRAAAARGGAARRSSWSTASRAGMQPQRARGSALRPLKIRRRFEGASPC